MAVAGYEVAKKETSAGSWDAEVDVGNVLTHQFTGLTASTAYDFRVRAYDGAGNRSAWSNIESGTTDAPVFDPSALDNLVCYYEADQLTGLSDGDPIDSITDLSGNGYHLTTSGGTRSTYQTGEFNGLPVMQFDGVDDRAYNAGPSSSHAIVTVAIVFKDNVATGVNEMTPLFHPIGGSPLFRREAADTFIVGISGSGWTPNLTIPQAKGAVVAEFEGGNDNVRVWVNGSMVYDGPLGAALPSTFTLANFDMGLDGTSNYGEVKIAAAFATTDVLSPTEISEFFATYNAKYDLY